MSVLDTLVNNATPIASGANIFTTALSGILGGKQRKEQEKRLNNQEALIDSMYAPDLNRRYLDTSEGKSFLNTLNTRTTDANERTENMSVVTGATPETVLASKENTNDAFTDGISRLAGMGTQYQDNLRRGYLGAKNTILNQREQMANQSAQSWSNMAGNSANLLGDILKMPQ